MPLLSCPPKGLWPCQSRAVTSASLFCPRTQLGMYTTQASPHPCSCLHTAFSTPLSPPPVTPQAESNNSFTARIGMGRPGGLGTQDMQEREKATKNCPGEGRGSGMWVCSGATALSPLYMFHLPIRLYFQNKNSKTKKFNMAPSKNTKYQMWSPPECRLCTATLVTCPGSRTSRWSRGTQQQQAAR